MLWNWTKKINFIQQGAEGGILRLSRRETYLNCAVSVFLQIFLFFHGRIAALMHLKLWNLFHKCKEKLLENSDKCIQRFFRKNMMLMRNTETANVPLSGRRKIVHLPLLHNVMRGRVLPQITYIENRGATNFTVDPW